MYFFGMAVLKKPKGREERILTHIFCSVRMCLCNRVRFIFSSYHHGRLLDCLQYWRPPSDLICIQHHKQIPSSPCDSSATPRC